MHYISYFSDFYEVGEKEVRYLHNDPHMVRVQDFFCPLRGILYLFAVSICRYRGTCPFQHAGNASEVTKS